jgi:2-keto-3-deoxy-L-fuconate dehydrogenase
MSGRLDGKLAFVTAAAQGIGRASAEAFAREGAKVIATDIDEQKLAALSGHNGIETERLDVLDDDAVAKTASRIGAPDILFNCAGYVHQGSILECSDEDWSFSFNLNVRSGYVVTRAFLPAMIANGGGSIINVASVAGSVKGIPKRFVYGATKAAVIGMTKALAIDFVKENIRANAICPGTVDTPSLGERIKALGDETKARADFVARQPMGRLATADEIAGMAVYLASDEARFVTGQTMIIDGGITI